jgi:N,N'-diacetyllegionaminate synthase
MNSRWAALFQKNPAAEAPSTFIIAEAGVNHNGSLDQALEMVEVAAQCEADAVKFQTFRADRLASAQAEKAHYQKQNTGDAENQHAMLKSLELSEEAHRALIKRCQERDILFLSTPFDEASADLLLHLGVKGYKLGSGDITNLPLIQHLARTGLPLILSTGMSTMPEVDEAVQAAREAGCHQLALLHCVTSYPSPAEESNLRVIPVLSQRYRVPAGFSDHTLGTHISVAAVAMGARIIEKHFTLDKALPGPDHLASATPDELKLLVQKIRQTESALGDGEKRVTPAERVNLAAGRRSLFWAASLPTGTLPEAAHFICLRPAIGLAPKHLPTLIGRRLSRAVVQGQPVNMDDF